MGFQTPDAVPVVTRIGQLDLSVESIAVPPLDKTGAGTGWGSNLHVRRDPVVAYWSRTYGGVPCPWSRLDVATGAVTTVTGRRALHGSLRSIVEDTTGSGAWALLDSGLSRIDLDSMDEISHVRKDLPKAASRLDRLGGSLLGLSSWTTDLLTVFDPVAGTVVKRLRTPPPEMVLDTDDAEVVDLLSVRAGVARRLDLRRMTLGQPRPIPTGSSGVAASDRIWLAAGTVTPDPRVPKLRYVYPTHVRVLDGATLAPLHDGPPIELFQGILGPPIDGLLPIKVASGLLLISADRFEPLARADIPGDFGPIAVLPDGRSAIGLQNTLSRPERLVMFRWAAPPPG